MGTVTSCALEGSEALTPPPPRNLLPVLRYYYYWSTLALYMSPLSVEFCSEPLTPISSGLESLEIIVAIAALI